MHQTSTLEKHNLLFLFPVLKLELCYFKIVGSWLHMCWPVIALHFAPSKAASAHASFYKKVYRRVELSISAFYIKSFLLCEVTPYFSSYVLEFNFCKTLQNRINFF